MTQRGGPIVSGKMWNLARAMYKRTEQMAFFSVTEFRRFGFHELPEYRNNEKAIGPFFNALHREGIIKPVGRTRAGHWQAKGRMITVWAWTEKGHARLSEV